MREKYGYRFGLVSILNHWVVAILFLSVLSLGFLLDFFGDGRALRGPWMEAHKAAGVILLVFAIWRICWRLMQGFPKEASHMPAWQVMSAKLVHWILLFAIVAMPISGILLSLYGERGINVFGLFIIPPRAENDFISNVSSVIHETLAYIVSATIFMHVGAVVKHHLIDKDDTLRRMLTTKRLAFEKKMQPPRAAPTPKIDVGSARDLSRKRVLTAKEMAEAKRAVRVKI